MQLARSIYQRQIFWVVVLLLLFGHLMLFSASGVLGLQRHQSEFYFVTRQAITALIGFVFLILLTHIKLNFLRGLAYPLMFSQIVLVGLTYVPHFGHSAGGAHRWLKLGGFVFQPSELAKISICLYLAHILSKNKELPFTGKQWLAFLTPIVILLGLIFKQPDMGTTVLLTATSLAMFFMAGISLLYVFPTVGLGAIGFTVAMLQSEYRRRRFFAFLNPWADPQGKGFQTIQSLVSFHSGKIFGTGIGNGNSKLFFLPEVHTDFIYALIAEELGYIGAVAVILVFLYLSYILFKTASRSGDPFSSLLAFGLALSLSLQVCVNLAGVTGLLPVKGLPLPFISWGRSALLINLCMIGIVLNIARQLGNKGSNE